MGKVVKLDGKQRSRAKRCIRLQPAPGHNPAREPSPLTPELKDFLDRTVVPILVKEYLAVNDLENELAKKDSDAAHFGIRTAAPPELRAVRP